MKTRHLLSFFDLSKEDLDSLLAHALLLKKERNEPVENSTPSW